MRKYLFLLLLFIFSVSYAENEVTRFLGIPIDGTKKEMIKKLKEKGFSEAPGLDMLEGEFNGDDVYLGIQTDNNKVWRIVVINKYNVDEANIRIKFNNLIHQFENNGKYVMLEKNNTISDSENINYEILVNSKRYQAAFYQKPFNLDCYNRVVWFTIREMYGKYHITIYYENKKNEANGLDL